MRFARSIVLSACIVTAGCCGPDRQRIAADRATYDWFAPMMVAYLAADPKLDEKAKETHLRGLRAWGDRITADELAAKVK